MSFVLGSVVLTVLRILDGSNGIAGLGFAVARAEGDRGGLRSMLSAGQDEAGYVIVGGI